MKMGVGKKQGRSTKRLAIEPFKIGYCGRTQAATRDS